MKGREKEREREISSRGGFCFIPFVLAVHSRSGFTFCACVCMWRERLACYIYIIDGGGDDAGPAVIVGSFFVAERARLNGFGSLRV